MKKFRYRMESILKIKIKLEDQAKLAYANALANLNREEEMLNNMKQKKLAYENEQRLLNKGRLNIKKIETAFGCRQHNEPNDRESDRCCQSGRKTPGSSQKTPQ